MVYQQLNISFTGGPSRPLRQLAERSVDKRFYNLIKGK
jgi:hypothetical protein